jgi:predicted nicotinamide N-methyase
MTSIAGFDAELTRVAVGADAMALWRVADLERHVDRRALLAGVDPPEPPYWAHLWSGALVLAAAVPAGGVRTAVELGCGLGLPGLVAARRGARVTFVDRIAAPLEFVRASARANGVGVDLLVADFTTPVLRARYDLILAAEVLYDRAAFPALARALLQHLAPGGRALLTDARRMDTHPFYADLDAAGLGWRATEHRLREEGQPVTVRLVEIRAP